MIKQVLIDHEKQMPGQRDGSVLRLHQISTTQHSAAVVDFNYSPAPLNQCIVLTESSLQIFNTLGSQLSRYPLAFPPVNIALSRHHSKLYLVSFADNRIALFSLPHHRPLCEWQVTGVVSVQWSPERPSVFYALDSQSQIHVFDLSENTRKPVRTITEWRHRQPFSLQLHGPYALVCYGTNLQMHRIIDELVDEGVDEAALMCKLFAIPQSVKQMSIKVGK